MSTAPPPPPSDPYLPPQVPSAPPSIPPHRAAAEVSGPATGLLITAILGGATQILGLLVNMLGIGWGSMMAGDQEERLINWISGGFGMGDPWQAHRPDGENREPQSVHCHRHLRRSSAHGGHLFGQNHRGHQQGRGRAHL